MNKKLKKAMAIVALVFMAVFTVSLILCFAMPTALNHGFGYITLFSGFVGISVFVVIKLSERAETKPMRIEKADDEEKAEKGAEAQDSIESEKTEPSETETEPSEENAEKSSDETEN